MRRGKRVQIAGARSDTADFVAATDAVVVVVVRTRDQLRRAVLPPESWKNATSSAGVGFGMKLSAGRAIAASSACSPLSPRSSTTRTERCASTKVLRKSSPANSVWSRSANQHGGFDLRGVGVEFAALMAKERVDRCDADLQQREEGDVELGHVAELHQRCLAAMQPCA